MSMLCVVESLLLHSRWDRTAWEEREEQLKC